ncbi:MAG: tetratricopeptide repeat protein [Gemmatimonadaceae bacterium]
MTRGAWWLLASTIGILALMASANSVTNGFTHDDVHLILRPARMHGLAGWWREFGHTYWPENWGGEGYRPLTIIAYRLQWTLGDGNPFVFHALNVALHVATSVAAFWLADALLPVAAAFAAAALYAAHPVHVEAIANVVGQSELWVVFLATVATGLYVHGRAAGAITRKRWVAIGAAYGAAMLFKEHAIVLPILLVLAEATVVADGAPLRERLARTRLPMLALLLVAAAYLWIRTSVVGPGMTGFTPYIVFQALDLSSGDRILTMVGAAPEWLRLLLWPARLMTEYSPPYIDVAQGPSLAQLPGLLILVVVPGLIVVCWRRSPVTAFGLAWLIVTLLPASNFVVPAGFIIAERTLLLPSLGAMLALASAIPWLYRRFERRRAAQYALAGALVALVALGAGKSITRNRVWRDNDRLFRQGVLDSPTSYRAHFLLGHHLFESNLQNEGQLHYRQALRLFPHDPVVAYDLAEKYRAAAMCERAVPLYRWVYDNHPTFPFGRVAFASCLLNTLRLDEARAEALHAIRAGERFTEARAIFRTAMQVRDTIAARRGRGERIETPPFPSHPEP